MLRALRLPAAVATLAASSSTTWPATVDDVYITLAYARRWAEAGALEWTTGERVEGYSNFLFLAAMAMAARFGADIDLFAPALAFTSAVAVLFLLHRRLPHTVLGTVALIATASFAPLGYWTAIGMETTAYAALLCLGWAWVLAKPTRWGSGIALLALASITRPEGVLHLVAALATYAVRPPVERRQGWLCLGAIVGLVAYHIGRIAWFGAFLPTPYLVKVSPVGITSYGAVQLAGDLLLGAGVAAPLVAGGSLRLRDAAWVMAPLLLQSATLVRASGDWMAWGRLVLPGVLASAVAFASLAQWRTTGSRTRVIWASLAAILASAFAPHGYGALDLRLRTIPAADHVLHNLRRGLETPVAEDVAWVIDHTPVGSSGLVVDAGMLGDIPGFGLIDMRGLTHRPAAVAAAERREQEWLMALLREQPGRPQFLRLANWDGTHHPDYPEWLVAGSSLRADLRYGGGSIRWYGTTDARPTPDERAARWDEVLRRHPSHPFLVWRAAVSAAESGDLRRAERLTAHGHASWPVVAEFTDAPGSYSFVEGSRALAWRPTRGFEVLCGEFVRSRPIQADERMVLVADGLGPGASATITDSCDGSTSTVDAPGSTPIQTCGRARSLDIAVRCDPEAGPPVMLKLGEG